MKAVFSLPLLCLCLIPFSSIALGKQTLKYDISGSSGWYPYCIDDADTPGIFVELIPLILSAAKLKGQALSLPPKRTQMALINGQIDFEVISPAWFPDDKIPPGSIISEPIMPVVERLIFSPEQAHNWHSLTLIQGQSVGTVRGYHYRDEAKFNRADFRSEKELVVALGLKRIQVAISGDITARYWAKNQNVAIVLGPVHSSGQLHIRMLQTRERQMAQINGAIRALRDNGGIQAVIERYIN